jgi:hypothetical protein
MTNKKLRQDLLKKLDITQQALSLRVQGIKKKHPMTTDDAVYVIAQQQGIILDRYLEQTVVDRVRGLIQQMNYALQPPQIIPKHENKRGGRSGQEHRVIVISGEFRDEDPILPSSKINEAKEMARIYPLLYILENSIREVIDRVMISKYGQAWWNSKAPGGLIDTADGRMDEEKKHSWHQRRGSRPIDYLDLDQLKALMRKIQKDKVVVPDIIPSLEWFDQFIDEVYQSRCVLCHMNPLDKDNIQAVKLRLRQWQKLIKSKSIP